MDAGTGQDQVDALVVAFGRVLAAERTAAGYSLQELSKRSGLSVESLHRYEHAKREVRLGDLRKITDALGVTPSELVTAAERRAARGAPAADQ